MNVFEAVRALRHTGLVTDTGHVVGSTVTRPGGPVDLVLGGGAGAVEVWRRDPHGPDRLVTHSTPVAPDVLVTEVYGVRLPSPMRATDLLGRLADVVPGWPSWSDRQIVELAEGVIA